MINLAFSTNAFKKNTLEEAIEAIARIGLQKLLAGETVSAKALDANYIRRSDAEIFAKQRR